MPGLLTTPEVQIVAVCDPVKDGQNYVDWSKDGLRAKCELVLTRQSAWLSSHSCFLWRS